MSHRCTALGRATPAVCAALVTLAACQDPAGGPAGESSASTTATSGPSAASSGAAGGQLEVDAPDLEMKGALPVVHARFAMLSTVMSASDEEGRRTSANATMVRVYLSDAPLQRGVGLSKGQRRVYFSLVGGPDSTSKTPLPPGRYDPTAPRFARVAEVELSRGTDDAEGERRVLAHAQGAVVVEEHTLERLVGFIDLHEGDVRLTGRFVATAEPR